MSDYIRSLRDKIGHDMIFSPGVAGIVVNEAGHVLLQRRSDTGAWGLPGGAIDPGEEPAEACAREVLEETNVSVIPERLVGVYGGLDFKHTYPNGDKLMVISLTFACRPISGEPRVNDDECLEVRYFAPGTFPELNPRDIMRIQHTLRNEPQTYFNFSAPL